MMWGNRTTVEREIGLAQVRGLKIQWNDRHNFRRIQPEKDTKSMTIMEEFGMIIVASGHFVFHETNSEEESSEENLLKNTSDG
jgi:hypothetical protein